MSKILYVTTVSQTINAFLIPHIKELMKNGHEVEIACNIDLELDDSIKDINFNRINFSRNPFKFCNIKAIKEIQNLFHLNKYDIVHVHTPIAAFITRLALRKENVEIIYTAHGFHFYKGASIVNWAVYYSLEKIASKWTDKLITINHEDFKRANKFTLRNNGKVYLMNGVGIEPAKYKIDDFNREDYRLKIGVSSDDFMILILAEINKNKNHIQVIKALELIDNKNLKVICAGEGPLKSELEKLCKKNNIDSVKFIGYRRDIKELINSTDCISLFSKREGLGKCLLEGMIAGNPIIATKTRGPKELVLEGENGYLVELEDYVNTGRVIEKLAQNKELRKTMGGKSKELVKKYDLDNILKFIVMIHKNDRKEG